MHQTSHQCTGCEDAFAWLVRVVVRVVVCQEHPVVWCRYAGQVFRVLVSPLVCTPGGHLQLQLTKCSRTSRHMKPTHAPQMKHANPHLGDGVCPTPNHCQERTTTSLCQQNNAPCHISRDRMCFTSAAQSAPSMQSRQLVEAVQSRLLLQAGRPAAPTPDMTCSWSHGCARQQPATCATGSRLLLL